ncbi:MAG: helix-turn-helix transcriptional regulator [Planctomycetes bacterium]|nr:helix-turn-helix transcriptional regulator [Planctomycetota bacterium]
MSTCLESALRRAALDNLPINDRIAEMLGSDYAKHAAEGTNQLLHAIEPAAAILDATPDASFDGTTLRLACDHLLDRAQELGAAAVTNAVDAARELEEIGAPAALLIGLDGKLLWLNSAADQVLYRRRLDRDDLVSEALEVALPVIAALRSLEPASAQVKQASRHVRRLRIHLSARLREDTSNPALSLVVVTISEARRSTRLSNRELHMARLIVGMPSYRAVANAANISMDTVRSYVRRIYRKLAVNSRYALKARLAREGVLEDPAAPPARKFSGRIRKKPASEDE